jgi:hypothetical protein
MTSPQRLRLVLLIDRVEPLEGEIEADAGDLHRFTGWTGLAVALEGAMQARAESGDGVRSE